SRPTLIPRGGASRRDAGLLPAAVVSSPDIRYPPTSLRAGAVIDLAGRIDRRARRRLETVAAQHCLQRGQAAQHVGLAANVAHGADAPDLGRKRPERGANLDAEAGQHLAAHLLAIA